MASRLRSCRISGASSSIIQQALGCQHSSHFSRVSTVVCAKSVSTQRQHCTRMSRSAFHTSTPKLASRGQSGGNMTPAANSLGALDVLASVPVPSTSIDITMSSGFVLNNGMRVTDGSGILIVGGEAFSWRPWESNSKSDWRLLNKKGQYDIAAQSLGLLAQLWPRPDLLVLGVGPENRPLSPELRKAISALGMRIEVLDTRNAAAQYNLLATERGLDDVAAALIPIGWVEGKGAGDDDDGVLTHE